MYRYTYGFMGVLMDGLCIYIYIYMARWLDFWMARWIDVWLAGCMDALTY